MNGDQIYNDRPGSGFYRHLPRAELSGLGSTIYCTPLGTFDASGATGKLAAHQLRHGPAHFVLNLRLTKTFGLRTQDQKQPSSIRRKGPGGDGGGGHGGGGGPRGPLFGGGGGGLTPPRIPIAVTT